MGERVVFKWNVGIDDRIHTIGGGQVVHVEAQHQEIDSVQVWTLESMSEPIEERMVQAFGTGQRLPDAVGQHLGSVVVAEGRLVWHLFEVIRHG